LVDIEYQAKTRDIKMSIVSEIDETIKNIQAVPVNKCEFIK